MWFTVVSACSCVDDVPACKAMLPPLLVVVPWCLGMAHEVLTSLGSNSSCVCQVVPVSVEPATWSGSLQLTHFCCAELAQALTGLWPCMPMVMPYLSCIFLAIAGSIALSAGESTSWPAHILQQGRDSLQPLAEHVATLCSLAVAVMRSKDFTLLLNIISVSSRSRVLRQLCDHRSAISVQLGPDRALPGLHLWGSRQGQGLPDCTGGGQGCGKSQPGASGHASGHRAGLDHQHRC